MRKLIPLAGVALALAIPSAAMAETIGPINFENYALGSIDGQFGWSKTGPYDATVEIPPISSRASWDFGKVLQISNAYTSGSFGDQTISPGLVKPVSEAAGSPHHFKGEFTIYADAARANSVSVSPDNGFSQPGFGPGGRMSYLRFVETPQDGIVVFFDDYRDGTFIERYIASLAYLKVHQIRFELNLKLGAPDEAKIVIDGKETKGTTWEQYYRTDPEASAWQSTGMTPKVDALMFRESGTAYDFNEGEGFLIDKVKLEGS